MQQDINSVVFNLSPQNSPTRYDINSNYIDQFRTMLFTEQQQLKLRHQIEQTQSNLEQLKLQQVQNFSRPNQYSMQNNGLVFSASNSSLYSSSSSSSSSSSIPLSPISPLSYSMSPPTFYLQSIKLPSILNASTNTTNLNNIVSIYLSNLC